MRVLKYNEAILEATDQLMELDPRVYVIGLGVPDPKGIFATTLGLQNKYGEDRVLDMPTSENGMTGIVIGSAIAGMRPIMTHQRVDFFFLALDQLINNASKWHFMFGDQATVPIVIRLIMGRGWGQGPQHCQTFHALFAHLPGIKVVMPATAYDAKGLLISAVQDDHPVIFFEHRWLHHLTGNVPKEIYRVPFGAAQCLRPGNDLTIIACSHMSFEAWKAASILEQEGVSAEVIDLRSIKPLDTETILESVRKTGHLLVVDPDWKFCGFASEVIASVCETILSSLKAPPKRVTYPDQHSPTSWMLANQFFPTPKDIAAAALLLMNKTVQAHKIAKESFEEKMKSPLDIPDTSFAGSF